MYVKCVCVCVCVFVPVTSVQWLCHQLYIHRVDNSRLNMSLDVTHKSPPGGLGVGVGGCMCICVQC